MILYQNTLDGFIFTSCVRVTPSIEIRESGSRRSLQFDPTMQSGYSFASLSIRKFMLNRKKQIMDMTEELLQTRSFSSFSYQDLSDQIGISKATIHHHFPTKDDLGIALAARYRLSQIATLENISRSHRTPWSQLETYFTRVSEIMRSGHKICLTGSLQAEHNVTPKAMQQELTSLGQFVHTWVTRVLAEGRKQKTMNFPGTPEDQASLILAAPPRRLTTSQSRRPQTIHLCGSPNKSRPEGQGLVDFLFCLIIYLLVGLFLILCLLNYQTLASC